jgi:hypothetical protein
MLKSVFEIEGGLPILVWEAEGGACKEEPPISKRTSQSLRVVPKIVDSAVLGVQPVIQSELARQGYSQEELYFSNLSSVLKQRLEQKKQFDRPN